MIDSLRSRMSYVLKQMCAIYCDVIFFFFFVCVFFQAEDGIRYLVRSRGLGDVYKRQEKTDM